MTETAIDTLSVLKALGDETRFAMYEELSAATTPLSAQCLAERLGLHPNTVRLHLERLREAGLVEVEPVRRGTVGRPQHAYRLAAAAPGLGFDPPAHALLAAMLAALAERAGARSEDAAETGRSWGVERGRQIAADSCVEALVAELDRLGFEPSSETLEEAVTVAFLHCPFREVAEAYPELVCYLHRGLCEGVVAENGGSIRQFASLYDHEPCRVTVSTP